MPYFDFFFDAIRRVARDTRGESRSDYVVLFAVVAVAGVLTFWTLRIQIDGTFACVPR